MKGLVNFYPFKAYIDKDIIVLDMGFKLLELSAEPKDIELFISDKAKLILIRLIYKNEYLNEFNNIILRDRILDKLGISPFCLVIFNIIDFISSVFNR